MILIIKNVSYQLSFTVLLFIPALLIALFFFSKFYLTTKKKLNDNEKLLSALNELYKIMVSLITLEETSQQLTDALAFKFGFKAGVLSLIDNNTKTLKRVAVSHTKAGLIGLKLLPIPYKQIGISLDDNSNILIKSIREQKLQITHDMYDLFVPMLSKEFVANLQKLMEIKTSFVYPIFSSNNRIIGTMIFSIGGNEGEVSLLQREAISRVIEVVGLVIERVYLYEEIAKTSKSLAQANQKLKELDQLKDEFVSVASHELRTPMTAIRSYSWMALYRSDVPLSQKLKKYLYRTLVSTERLINLVNDMLNVSRIESGRIEISPKPFDMLNLVMDVFEEVAARASENRVKLNITPTKVPEVFADPDKIHQVLLNLVGNALKFTPPQGVITVSFFTDGQVLETSVKDTGVGISKADQGMLFKKFGRLDNSYVAIGTSGGTGLGLYISKSLVELMNGKIRVSSEGQGQGATFTFSLPLATDEMIKQAEHYHIKPAGEAKALEPVAI